MTDCLFILARISHSHFIVKESHSNVFHCAQRTAGTFIMHAVQNTPWNLSEGYHSWKSGRGQVVVVGPGDPTGRCLGVSYLKEQTRKVLQRMVW